MTMTSILHWFVLALAAIGLMSALTYKGTHERLVESFEHAVKTTASINDASGVDFVVAAVGDAATPAFPKEPQSLNPSVKDETPSNQENDVETIYAWQHIPKTGGSSTYQGYMKALQEKLNHTIYPDSDGRQIPFDWNSPGCTTRKPYGGTHCASSEIGQCLRDIIHPNNTNLKVKFLSTVRHPVTRVISEYYWWNRQRPGGPWTRSMIQNKANLTAWILDEGNVAHNRQALYFMLDKRFPSSGECIPFAGLKALNFITQEFGSTQAFNNISLPDSILDSYAFVAILEDPEGSNTAFEKVFGIQPKALVGDRHSSGSGKKNEVDASLIRLIEERNQLDLQLFYAVKRWQQQMLGEQ